MNSVRYTVPSHCADSCRVAPSTYYEHKARQREPERHPARYQRDQWLKPEIQRVWDENMQVYGVRKVWRQLNREFIKVARCTVERLMNQLGIQGAIRGKKCWTTISDAALYQPADLVDRQLFAVRPNQRSFSVNASKVKLNWI